MDEKEGRKARLTIADKECFTKALGLHSSRLKGYEPAISGQKMAYSNKKENISLEAFQQHHPSPCRPRSRPCRPLARQPYCPKPKSLEGPVSAHHPG